MARGRSTSRCSPIPRSRSRRSFGSMPGTTTWGRAGRPAMTKNRSTCRTNISRSGGGRRPVRLPTGPTTSEPSGGRTTPRTTATAAGGTPAPTTPPPRWTSSGRRRRPGSSSGTSASAAGWAGGWTSISRWLLVAVTISPRAMHGSATRPKSRGTSSPGTRASSPRRCETTTSGWPASSVPTTCRSGSTPGATTPPRCSNRRSGAA